MIVMLGIWVEVGTAQTITETDMPDANLRAAVLARLKTLNIVVDSATTFTRANMANTSFTVFSGYNDGISDMTGLKYATSLTELNLNSNSISTIRTDLPTSLKKLHLRENSISTIPDLSGLTVLEWLYLTENSISTIPTNLPTSLKDLRINDNSISAIPNLSNLGSLTTLNLSNNSISTIPTTNLPTSLKDLSLGGNDISAIPDLSGLTSLIALRLYNNSISNISEVSKLTLTNLELQDNSISDISDLAGKTSLKTLLLGNNNISDISTVSSLTSLKHLELYNNNCISDISALANLTSLLVLDLGGNCISDISDLANLTNLTTLYISRNKISDISVLAGLTNLLFLSLRNNEITTTDALLTLTVLDSLWLGDNRITDVSEFQKLSSLTSLYFLSLDSSYTNQLSILDDPAALRAYLYVPRPPAPLTVTFGGYPEDKPTDEFTLTIRFPEPVTGFEKEDITVETELTYGTGTATLEALTPVGGTEQPNSEGEVEVSAQTYVARIKLPTNAGGTVKLIVHSGAARTSAGRVTPTTATASKPIEFGRRRRVLVFPSYVAMDKVIFNEFRNAENDTHDWIELKNISDKEVSLKEWEISIVASEGEYLNTDRDIVAFPDYTLPPNGILLIVNTDPSENDLLRGQDIENPDHNPKLRPLYLIRPEMKLPNTLFLLILRNARDKNGKWEGFEDLAGDYHRGDVNYRTQIWPLRDTWVYTGTGARFSEGDVYQRIMRPKGAIPMKPSERGYFQNAWVVSDYQSGLGYDPDASAETSLGTPGYATTMMTDDIGTGHISFSEVMFTTNERGSPSQWVELYNNSTTEVVDLEGWKLVIEVRDSQPVHRYITFHFKSLEVMPNQTMLLVTRNDRTSGNIPERRIYDVQHQNRKALLLRPEGFALRLLSPDGTLVDMAGNLNGRMGQDKPRWQLPSGWSESGARSSLIRVYEDRVPAQGTIPGSWVRAAETALIGAYTYWGLETDNGTPGYRQGSPLPVTLSSFRADLREGTVVVNWTTASEMENAGFNILRSETKKGEFGKVNPTLILGAGTTAEQKTYAYTDTTAKPKVAYYYQIEEVSLSGERRPLATVRMRGHLSAVGKLLGTWSTLKVVD